jgi:hypothetical protein
MSEVHEVNLMSKEALPMSKNIVTIVYVHSISV